jgi:hypothetical protein
MNKDFQFKVFCLESYKSVHSLSGPEALDIFVKFDVFSYLEEFYDVLHTTGRLFMVKDIDEYINARSGEGILVSGN